MSDTGRTADRDNFCDPCANIDLVQAVWANKKPVKHHDNYRALEKSVVAGCRLCRVFRQVLLAEQAHFLEQTEDEAIDTLRQESEPALWLTIGNTGGNLLWKDSEGIVQNGLYRHPTFRIYWDSGDIDWPADNPPTQGRLVKEWPDLVLCKAWVTSCASLHADCGQLKVYELPTRLIEIGEGAAGYELKLVETSGCQGQYVTLSHCWGTGRRFMTTEDNLASHLRSLRFEDLPLTFQDAVSVTAALGFHYLWIDSICIIQGDKDDWERECARMAQTYELSAVTIASPASASADGGLIHRRPMRAFCEVPIRTRASDVGALSSLGRIRESMIPQSNTTVHSLSGPGYCRRDFYRHACCTLEADSFPLNVTHRLGLKHTTTGYQMLHSRMKELIRKIFTESPFYRWKEVVQMYMRCKLTYGQDKLPALSGIARRFSQLVDDDYLAGLWRSDIRYGLLWVVDAQRPGVGWERKSSHVAKYSAPSWSWASSDYEIRHDPYQNDCGGRYGPLPEGHLDHPFEVIDATVTRDSADDFGETTSGTIVLRAPLKRSVIQRNGDEGHGREAPDLPLFLCRSSQDATPVAEFVPDHVTWLTLAAGHRQEVYCLFVVSTKFYRFVALALEIVVDCAGNSTFRRLGRLSQHTNHRRFVPRWAKMLDNTGDWFHDADIETVHLV
ncbi:hypothetical protein LTR27_003671 [Elasticomyces elasticus]|nr:hypothetical protein LTR27_003671 [Elasticomyces elasticus]